MTKTLSHSLVEETIEKMITKRNAFDILLTFILCYGSLTPLMILIYTRGLSDTTMTYGSIFAILFIVIYGAAVAEFLLEDSRRKLEWVNTHIDS